VFLNAGVIHRVGPSRLYVHLARALAELGCVAARFDHSGIGDSPVRRDGLPFEQSSIAEAREAMDWLQQTRGLQRFVLVGLCSGAVTAFETAVVDERVRGIVMINPQGFDQSPEWNSYMTHRSQARRYWTQSLFSAESWMKALRGRVDYQRLASVLWRQVRGQGTPNTVVSSVVSRVAADLDALTRRRVASLLLCSEGDDGIDYMNVILGRDVRRVALGTGVTVEILPGADHSLTLIDSQRGLVRMVCRWAAAIGGALEGHEHVSERRDAAAPAGAVVSVSR